MKVVADNIGFSYGDTRILQDICFEANPGEITTIIGTNGAGKTTLLKCIADMHSHEGNVLFDGETVPRKESCKFVGYLEQATDCEVDLNVFEIVLLGMVQNLSFYVSEEESQKVDEVLELLGIQRFASRKIGELSGGQRQLVFIAQALVKDPKVLILDEPTSALDLYHQFKLIELIRKITVERGCTTIMTLHHLDVTMKYSDKVVVVANKSVYQVGTTEEVFTENMLSEVYHVRTNIIKDENGDRHIIVKEPEPDYVESDSFSD